MTTNEIPVDRTKTVADDLDRLHQAIRRKAYEFFRSGTWGDAVTDWLNAEQELVAKPRIELTETDGRFEVLAALPGVEAKELDVKVTSDLVIIAAGTARDTTSTKGTVHVSEFSRGQIFRSIRFPEAIDPGTVKAEFKNGMLRLSAVIAQMQVAKPVAIKAA
jgi:HSP20 family protein